MTAVALEQSEGKRVLSAHPSVLTTLIAGAVILTLHLSLLASQHLGAIHHPVDIRTRVVAVGVVALATAILAVRRRDASDKLCAVAFVMIVGPFYWTFWLLQVKGPWEGMPFVGPKLILFVIASLCPTRPRWLAPLMVVAACVEMTVLWIASRLGLVPAIVEVGEPWVSACYALLAGLLFGFRLHWMRQQERLVAAEAERAMLKTTNDAFVAVQDLANTPLQRLEIALTLMKRERDADPLVRHAQRAVESLRRLTHDLPVERAEDARVDARALEAIRTLRAGRSAQPTIRLSDRVHRHLRQWRAR